MKNGYAMVRRLKLTPFELRVAIEALNAKRLKQKANSLAISAKSTLDNAKAEGYIDTGVKIIIGVVVGAVILGGLYALFNTIIIPRLNTEIQNMFNYAG